MNPLQEAIKKAVQGQDLSEHEMRLALGQIMDGKATDAQIGAFLTSLRMKGETIDEIAGAVAEMRDRALRMTIDAPVILDTCGTGGDGSGTFNISTACAFVCAASGVIVAKHGNRAVSSSVGSADVLEALGVRIDLGVEGVERCIDEVGIGFLFAPAHHSALRHAAKARREIGFRSVLNLLGPMTNPAGATHQLIGVFSKDRIEVVARVLLRLGTQRAMVVHGADGLDELTLSGPTHAAILSEGKVRTETIESMDFGFPRVQASELKGGSADVNARMIRDLLSGKQGPPQDIVILNAGAALWVAERADNLADGVDLARELIRSGQARERLEALIAASNKD